MENFNRVILRGAALPTAVVGLLVVLVMAFTGGAPAAIGGLLGVLTVLVFFILGQFILAAVLRRNPTMALSVAMLLYLVKIGSLAILLVVLSDTAAFDTRMFAINILISTLVWTGAEVWIFASTKVLYVDPDNMPDFATKGSGSDTRSSSAASQNSTATSQNSSSGS